MGHLLLSLAAVGAATALPPPVTGDFDRDGRPDSAVLQHVRNGSYTLVVTHASGAKSQLRLGATGHPVVLKLAAPGEVALACVDANAPAAACPGAQFQSGDTLAIGGKDSAEEVVLWTGKQFALIALQNDPHD